MSAQSSLKAIAEAILERTIPRTISAQSKKEAAQYPHIAQNTGNLQIESISAWLHKIGELESGHYLVLDKCKNNSEALAYFLGWSERETAAQPEILKELQAEKRSQKVLSMLTERPDTKRAYVTDNVTDPDNVILSVAIRNLATFEILIPKEKYDPFMLMELIDKGGVQ